MRDVVPLLFLIACGGSDGAGAADASSGDAVASCVTTIACTSDSDCSVAPGTRCNTALPVPRCEPLECGVAAMPCAGPEFCKSGLVCFDEQHFGESTTIYKAGVCTEWPAVRNACNTRCMQAWTYSNGMVLEPCSQQQATTLCQDVCATYPAWTDPCLNYFTRYNSNDFRFGYVNCPTSGSCPFVGMRCGTTDTNLAQSCQ